MELKHNQLAHSVRPITTGCSTGILLLMLQKQLEDRDYLQAIGIGYV